MKIASFARANDARVSRVMHFRLFIKMALLTFIHCLGASVLTKHPHGQVQLAKMASGYAAFADPL